MPRASKAPEFPLNGLFPIEKPSGPGSMKVIDMIKPILCESRMFYDPERQVMSHEEKRRMNKKKGGLKIGQGGTLDPLADGVLVIGVGKGTKQLSQFLECTKSYIATGLLGCATTTYDSEGPVLSTAPYKHVTREMIEGVLDQFRGHIRQVPPIFSALKMDGKPLYEYARENKPLPRPIPSRPQTITELVLESFTPASVVPGDGGHNFSWPEKHLSTEERETFKKLNELAKAAGVEKPGAEVDEEAMMNGEDGSKETVAEDTLNDVVDEAMDPEIKPATFKIRMTVSSGTYVRSIVHDIGLAIGSAAHVVTLTRTRQGRFALSEEDEDEAFDKAAAAKEEEQEEPTQNGPEDAATKGLDTSLRKGGCVPWSVWERAIEEHKLEQHSERMADQAVDDEWVPKEWERELYARFQPV